MTSKVGIQSKENFTGVVIPAFNEAPNLEVLIPHLINVLESIDSQARIIVVDDGSRDDTNLVLKKIMSKNKTIEVLRLPTNRGKAKALQLGFSQLCKEGASKIVMMDADGQDDPKELIKLLKYLDEKGGLVTGARIIRKDRFIKRWTSRLFNRTTSLISGVSGQDFNSGYKVMTRECAEAITPFLYGDLHRYITVIANWEGFRTSEIQVEHHKRLYGETKYGANRFWRGLIDLITVRFLMSYRFRPAHLFGTAGVIHIIIGTFMFLSLVISWIQGNRIGDRPLLIVSVLLLIIGVQLVSFGLLAELLLFNSKKQSLPERRIVL
jgi:glycosyltransferase involved in cell wall biosynthesis